MEEIEEVENAVGKVEEVVKATITETEQKIDAWFVQHFHGVQEMTITVFNRAQMAKEELKKILKEV